nr:MAG TPA: hypothetical protein [Caudoviricetes sp.]
MKKPCRQFCKQNFYKKRYEFFSKMNSLYRLYRIKK